MAETSQLHASAFQTGEWRVRHRKLARRLQGDTTWVEFGGTCRAHELLDCAANVDDFLIEEPAGPYRAATFRRIDPETGDWMIYWADARRPDLDEPMRGRFKDGVGTFLGDDTLTGATSGCGSSGRTSARRARAGNRPPRSMARSGR